MTVNVEPFVDLFRKFFVSQQRLLISSLGKAQKIQKKEGGELVGELDFKIQERFLAFVQKNAPRFAVVSEEQENAWPPKTENFIVFDPLDGTHNFLAGLPIFGSVLVVFVNYDPVFSAIFLPVDEELSNTGYYFAMSGNGAWRWNSKRRQTEKIVVSAVKDLREAFIWLEGSSKNRANSSFVQRLLRVDANGQTKIRRDRAGISTAYSITRLAAGGNFPAGADAVIAVKNKPTDNLPGCLFVPEAGGHVTTFDGKPWSLENCGSLIYSNGPLHDQLLKIAEKEA